MSDQLERVNRLLRRQVAVAEHTDPGDVLSEETKKHLRDLLQLEETVARQARNAGFVLTETHRVTLSMTEAATVLGIHVSKKLGIPDCEPTLALRFDSEATLDGIIISLNPLGTRALQAEAATMAEADDTPANVSLHVFNPHDIVLIREVVADAGWVYATALLGEGVEDMAAIMDQDVAAWASPAYRVIVFRRCDNEMLVQYNKDFEDRGWISCGKRAVRSYGSLTEYRASPG